MPLTLDDLNLRTDLPRLPDAVRLFATETPSLDQRRLALDTFRKTLELDELRPVELPHSLIMTGKRGEVEYFYASGAVWARDAEAEQRGESEFRDWPQVEERRQDNDVIIGLPARTEATLVRQALELLRGAELISDAMNLQGMVALEQVSQLSEKGELLKRGAGDATIHFRYELDGIPVFGAGAKSQVYTQPSGNGARTTGAFHCWRPTGGNDDRKVRLQAVEKALAVGLLQDPELNLYHERGARIQVTKLSFGYMALPAMMRQHYLYPVFQVEGQVHTPRDKQQYFEFARYHHAVSPEDYREAGVMADYLLKMN